MPATSSADPITKVDSPKTFNLGRQGLSTLQVGVIAAAVVAAVLIWKKR